MARKVLVITLICAMVGFAAACKSVPVGNVEREPIAAPPTASLEDVRNAIIRAGTARGWQMRPVADGHLVASFSKGSHRAVIDIFYSRESYSIVYQDSENLRYDGSQIHGAYNAWVRALQQDITRQVAAL